ncbi:MAG: hypothetical protein F6K22_01715 [Okeania sp. SIO2F4]|uniref:hypothetical protein n=1 Tax=Okeania sp. SIO2F4 TaxID=2607790 RepID=UPI00142A05BA|nr:hypothetical protein [Okeania sp. SIO2F4]NES01655.1 hypothetical protein [Okeania sp. SIO2F4]
MSRIPAEKIYLEIGFRSPETYGNLKTIELLGVPGERLNNGECVVGNKTKNFFDTLIVRELFRQSRFLPNCNFEYLKIWLYDTEIGNNERGYSVPTLDRGDLEIESNIPDSKLERIYVLDNELTGQEYQSWRRNAENLFNPLFRKFMAPPELSSFSTEESIANNPLIQLFKPIVEVIDKTNETIDKYAKMKQSLFFNALIIQID